MPDMNSILVEVEQALPKTKWTRTREVDDRRDDAVFYKGESESGWRFTIVAFGCTPDFQNFEGYDGAAHKDGVVMHLTRELAEKAFKLAAAPPATVLQEVAEIIRVVLLVHEGKTITPELARERANNAAQALAIFEIQRRP